MVGLADPASFWNESMIRLRRKLAVLGLAGVVALAFGVEGRATPPDPGTRISSQAILDYIDPVSFVSDETPSNIVRVVVSGIPLINVTQDNSLTRTAGGYFEFAHQLTNTGNVTGTYTITPSLVGATAFDLLNAQLVLDLNGNGLVDTGEPRLPLAPYTVTLAPGQTLDFVVTGQVSPSQPASLPPSSVGHFSFAVSLAETGATASNTDTLTVVVTPGVGDLQFFKTISTPQAVSGDTVIYTLTGTNNYPADMSAINVTIDGAITFPPISSLFRSLRPVVPRPFTMSPENLWALITPPRLPPSVRSMRWAMPLPRSLSACHSACLTRPGSPRWRQAQFQTQPKSIP
jgi:uncharacterized repeat protein (TIGR01451 family)